MKKRSNNSHSIDTGRWLTTYSDLMNNMLVLFIALYAMSVVDAGKYQKFINSFSENFGSGISTSASYYYDTSKASDTEYIAVPPDITSAPPETTITPPEQGTDEPPSGLDEFDELYQRINSILIARGFEDQVAVEKIDGYIYFRFLEGMFFYPDQAILKESSYPAIETVGEILSGSYDLIATIEIAGHTAKVTQDPPSTTDFFSWELSSDRALTVLKFLVKKCSLPQAKMSITGYSSTRPFAEGFSEEYWALNRRVEIRISKNVDYTS